MDIKNLEARTRYVIMEDDGIFIQTESSDMYDFHVSRTCALENATFYTLDGAQTVVSELTGLTRSKYRYHMRGNDESFRGFSPGDLIIVGVTFTPTLLN